MKIQAEQIDAQGATNGYLLAVQGTTLVWIPAPSGSPGGSPTSISGGGASMVIPTSTLSGRGA